MQEYCRQEDIYLSPPIVVLLAILTYPVTRYTFLLALKQTRGVYLLVFLLL